jgi:F-type H+-transporting ATPase subunit b
LFFKATKRKDLTLEKLGINLGFLLVQIFNFAIIFIVLKAWVYKPMLNMMETREKKIAQGLEDARVAADARANAEEDANRIIREAQSKAATVVKEATTRAELLQKEIESKAKDNIEAERKAALADVEAERIRLLSDIRGDVSAIAIAAAQKLIGEALDEKRQHALLTQFFSGVQSGKVTILDNVSMQGASAEVTSALPLTDEEQSQIKADLKTNVGEIASISFRVDPSILGGLVIRVGDQVVDGSVASQLSSLRQAIA